MVAKPIDLRRYGVTAATTPVRGTKAANTAAEPTALTTVNSAALGMYKEMGTMTPKAATRAPPRTTELSGERRKRRSPAAPPTTTPTTPPSAPRLPTTPRPAGPRW